MPISHNVQMKWKAFERCLKAQGNAASRAEFRRRLAEEIGVDLSYLSKCLHRKHRPTDEFLLAMEKATGGDVSAESWISELREAERSDERAA